MKKTANKDIKEIVIIGASGFGREIAWLIERINKVRLTWDLLGFLDDNHNLVGNKSYNYEILGTTEWLKSANRVYVVCAIGASKIRRQVINRIDSYGIKNYATLVDPSVIMSDSNLIGKGSIICANSVITVNTNIGNHVIVNLSCTIGHESIVGDFVTLYPNVNVSGNCNIHNGVELGTGTKIIQSIVIGQQSVVGAGAVVISDIPEGCTAVGVPAKPTKFHEILI